MNSDNWNQVINGEETYKTIAKDLLERGSCIIGWTDGRADHRDIMFTFRPKKYGYLQRGLNWAYLFVSIIECSSMGFLIEDNTNNIKHPNYIKEKLKLRDNQCDDAICELINGVIKYIDLEKDKIDTIEDQLKLIINDAKNFMYDMLIPKNPSWEYGDVKQSDLPLERIKPLVDILDGKITYYDNLRDDYDALENIRSDKS